MTPLIKTADDYLEYGCMRCKWGNTPQCKVHTWKEELTALRHIVLSTGLKEEIKWSVPVYTYQNKNIATIAALKDNAHIGFFKGVLLSDPYRVLEQQGNLQSDRIIRFKDLQRIQELEMVLVGYIHEAMMLEDSGVKVVFQQNPEPIPEDWRMMLEGDFELKEAFYALTPGRRRGYLIQLSKLKKSETRLRAMKNFIPLILSGRGLHDR
jgi:uncharacterized protein YdeI (YjbR/CyaY-like superfamily)